MLAPVGVADQVKGERALGFEIWEGCLEEGELGRQGAGQQIYWGFPQVLNPHAAQPGSLQRGLRAREG